MTTLFYNIYTNDHDAFLGTVRVELPSGFDAPAKAARSIANEITGGGPKGIRAIMSTEEMFKLYGLNR